VLPIALAALAWVLVVVRPASTDALRDYWDDQLTIATAPDAARALLPFEGATPLLLVALAVVTLAAARERLGLLVGAPLVLAAVAAAAGVAPLGGGRTDLHLLPSVALLLATALHRAPAPDHAGWVFAAGLPFLTPGTDPYPAEDVGPLVAVVESEASADDRILVYSASRWAYGLEADADVDVVRDRTSANGFDVVVGDERVTVLEPGGAVPTGGDRLWLLVSHGGDDVAGIREDIAAAGYSLDETWTTPGADLTRWHRLGGA
jgi:hypothetical protein